MNRLIPVGTIIDGGASSASTIRHLLPYGFERFALHFGGNVDGLDLAAIASDVRGALDGTNARISCVGVYGNPLMDSEKGRSTCEGFERLIDTAHLFGTDLVTGFAGALIGKSVEETLPAFVSVFGPLAERARRASVRIAFENCPAEGSWRGLTWNLAFHPAAWEMMFDALPLPNIGLQWEPAHQLGQLIDPIPQLRRWAGRIFNVHGKDALLARDVIASHGVYGKEPWIWHRMPGLGMCDWSQIVTILMMNGYAGSIDIEGWHDPVFRDELEYTGQIAALHHLKRCRGGEYIENPA